jgi:DNA polymerase-3 subunit beta
MQVTLSRVPLAEDLRLAERLLPLRSPEPVLEHVLLRAGPAGCTLVAHDREVTLWLPLAGEVSRPGAALLPGRRLLALLRPTAAETIQVEREGVVVRLQAPGLTCRLLGCDPDCFPETAPFPPRAHVLLPAGPLRQAIRRTLFAAAPGPGHCRDYLLEAVLCEADPGALSLVASDNRRLAAAEVTLLPPGLVGRPRRLLLSVRALALLARLAHGQEEPIRAFLGPPAAFFRVGRATLAARLLRGRFPDWQTGLHPGAAPGVDVPVGPLLAGVRQAAVLREPAHARLLLRLEPGRLILESGQTGAGTIEVEQAVPYTGLPVTLTFSPGYLQQLLQALEGDEEAVRLAPGGARQPALFTAPGYRHALMPLRPITPSGPPAPQPVFTRKGSFSQPAPSPAN